MNTTDHVCSLRNAEKLKGLDVKQASIFYWHVQSDGDAYLSSAGRGLKIIPDEHFGECMVHDPDIQCYSAFTASELIRMLPRLVDTKQDEPFNCFRLNIQKSVIVDEKLIDNNLVIKDIYIINYDCDTTTWDGGELSVKRSLCKSIYDINFSNAIAKMLIYLLENKLLCIS